MTWALIALGGMFLVTLALRVVLLTTANPKKPKQRANTPPPRVITVKDETSR